MMSVITFHRDKKKPRNVHRARNFGKFEVKKRIQCENEVLGYDSKVETVHISYGDRFIPRRQHNARVLNNLSLSFDENENDIFCIKEQPFYWRKHNYRINIGMQLDANTDENLLNFHDKTTQQNCDRSFNQSPTMTEFKVPNQNIEELDWACIPRSKPLAYSESTHDMPEFREYVNGENIIDWSCRGYIAAGFSTGSSLVIWSPPPTQDAKSNAIAFTFKNLCALKFSPKGHLLAIGLKREKSSLLRFAKVTGQQLIVMDLSYRLPGEASIRCIEWASTEKIIICGMSTGMVHINSYPEMNVVHCIDTHKTAIANIKYSVYNAFIAINDNDGNLSILLNKPNYNVYLKHKNVNFIAWHPWIETNLLIGCKSPASIHLLDLKTKTTIAHYRRTDAQYTLCTMSINPLSAELVVSFSHQVNGNTRSDILVMASMNRIVDNISAHQDAVNYILWDQSGTKIATIGQDESLNIWNFFGKSQQKADELKKIQDNRRKPVLSHLNLDSSFMQLR